MAHGEDVSLSALCMLDEDGVLLNDFLRAVRPVGRFFSGGGGISDG